jgi:hypothetical protein
VTDEFDDWMTEVNTEVVAQAGVRALDLPDAEYRAWYDEGISPQDVAELVLGRGM